MNDTPIEWNEYRPDEHVHNDYQDTLIKCPSCGNFVKRYIRMVFLTYPPEYRYDCPNCGWSGYK